MMKRYIEFLDNYKGLVVGAITLLVLVCSFWLKDLAFEGSYRIWFAKDSKIMKEYDSFTQKFNTYDSFIVGFRDDNGIFNQKAIQTILHLSDDIRKLDGVYRVNSLCNYQNITSDEDDLSVEDLIYEDEIGNLKAKKLLALQDRLILNRFISKDGKTTLLFVNLSDSTSGDEEVNLYLFDKLQKLAKEYKQKYGYDIYITGAPAITASLVQVAVSDAMVLLPLSVVLVVGLLWFLFRDFLSVATVSMVIVYTFLLVLSMEFMLGYKLNNFTVNIPAFIAAIAIADSLHLLISWRHNIVLKQNKQAVILALKENMLPMAMTSFTTATGFATLAFSDIVPIKTLAYAITTGAIVAFLFTIVLVPSVLLYIKSYAPKRTILDRFSFDGYGKFIVKNDKKIVAIFAMLFVILGFGIGQVNIDNNSIKYFDKHTTVRSGSDFIQKHITGSMQYEVIIDTKTQNGIKNPKFLKTVDRFESELREKFANVTFVVSIKDILQKMHKVLMPNSPTPLPQDSNLVAQYILLYSMSIPQNKSINDQIDNDYRYIRLTFNSKTQTTSKDLAMIEWIKQWWSKQEIYNAKVEGVSAIFTYMQECVISTLTKSLSWTFVIIFGFMLLIFRRLKMFWLFVLPNIAPVIMVAGIMGYLGVDVDIGVVISASVILGIAIDDTIHFFSKYFKAKESMSFEQSIDYVLKHSGSAMILTTFVLSITFSVFAFSSFVPNNNFAFVTISSLNLALLFDLVVLPAFLSLVCRE